MNDTQRKAIEKLLSEIDIDANLEGEEITTFDELRDYLEDNDYFNVEIIYYSNAMQYLHENDNSLTESLALAHDMGYTLENLNSETLASLLASQNTRNDFEELEGQISDILDNNQE